VAKLYALLALFLSILTDMHAKGLQTYIENNATNRSSMTKEQKLLYVNLALNTGLLAYGIGRWGYDLLNRTPHAQSEAWFGQNTKHGGADKFGHAYTGHLATHVLGYDYEEFGYSHEEASFNAMLSSILFTSTMEIGDSFSDFGLSYEDFVANIVGAVFGYYSFKYKSFGDKIDYRFEFMPDINMIKDDFTTEYEKNKFLLVLKASGFSYFKESYLKYVELYAGYTISGYYNEPYTRERETFFGIGINLSELLNSKVFNYYQIPKSYLSTRNE
jgi:hypothetical protein